MPEFEIPSYGETEPGLCSTCGALVPEHAESTHTEWHGELFHLTQTVNRMRMGDAQYERYHRLQEARRKGQL